MYSVNGVDETHIL